MKKGSRKSFVTALAATFMISIFGFGQQPANAMDTGALANAFDTLHWVTYSPLDYDPNKGKQPSDENVKADLMKLKQNGFGGIVTYGATGKLATLVPEEANKLGLKMIVGVWDPKSGEELNNAVKAAKLPNVLAIVVGNERLWDKYRMPDPKYCYTLGELSSAMANVRSRSGKPVTTSQQCKSYSEQNLIDACDFEFPTVHPFWTAVHEVAPRYFDASQGVEWTISQIQDIKSRSGSKLVVAKEVGYPTGGAGAVARGTKNYPDDGITAAEGVNEKTQADYYVKLTQSPLKHNFCYFEAYDQDWKKYNATEPHWGLFGGLPNRTAKPAMAAIKAVW